MWWAVLGAVSAATCSSSPGCRCRPRCWPTRWSPRVADLIPVALLAALVAVQVLAPPPEAGRWCWTPARRPRVAVLLLLARAPFLVVVFGPRRRPLVLRLLPARQSGRGSAQADRQAGNSRCVVRRSARRGEGDPVQRVVTDGQRLAEAAGRPPGGRPGHGCAGCAPAHRPHRLSAPQASAGGVGDRRAASLTACGGEISSRGAASEGAAGGIAWSVVQLDGPRRTRRRVRRSREKRIIRIAPMEVGRDQHARAGAVGEPPAQVVPRSSMKPVVPTTAWMPFSMRNGGCPSPRRVGVEVDDPGCRSRSTRATGSPWSTPTVKSGSSAPRPPRPPRRRPCRGRRAPHAGAVRRLPNLPPARLECSRDQGSASWGGVLAGWPYGEQDPEPGSGGRWTSWTSSPTTTCWRSAAATSRRGPGLSAAASRAGQDVRHRPLPRRGGPHQTALRRAPSRPAGSPSGRSTSPPAVPVKRLTKVFAFDVKLFWVRRGGRSRCSTSG